MKKNLLKRIVSGFAAFTMVFTFAPVLGNSCYALDLGSLDIGSVVDAAKKSSDIVNKGSEIVNKVSDKATDVIGKVIGIDPVSDLTVLEYDEDEITLGWSKVLGAKSYAVYQYSSKNETWDKVGVTESTSYEIKDLASASIFKFKVCGLDSNGNEAEFSEVLETATKPQEVDNLVAKKAKTTITLSWDKVKRATKYQVYKYNNKTGTWSRIATTEKNSYKVTDLKSGTTYKFKVRAYRKALDDIFYGDFESITAKTTGSSSSSSGYIGEEKAKSIALAKATVSESNAKYLMVNLDKEDGIVIYEVEFESGDLEYSVEINAKTGRIIEFEKDYVWD